MIGRNTFSVNQSFNRFIFAVLAFVSCLFFFSYGFFQAEVRVHLVSHEHSVITTQKTESNNHHSHHEYGHHHHHEHGSHDNHDSSSKKNEDAPNDSHSIDDHLLDYNLFVGNEDCFIPTTYVLALQKISADKRDQVDDDLKLLYQARAPPAFS